MLAEHHHTGRLLPHHHTSYAGLMFVLILTAVFIAAFSMPSRADTAISSRVEGPPPTTGATITSPFNNQNFSSTPIQVSGHCPDNTYVQILRNNIVAGSVICPPSNNFSLLVDLTPGVNALKAQDYDFLDQPGPSTPTVTVSYTQPIPPSATNPQPPVKPPSGAGPKIISLEPLVITTPTPVLNNLAPNKLITWPVKLSGGRPPYALRWGWGDGTADIFSVQAAGIFSPTHTYKRPGQYSVIINASDSADNSAYLQLSAIVNGAPIASRTVRSDGSLLIAWPLWGLAALMMLSFWLGDKYKKARSHAPVPSIPVNT